MKEFNAVRFQDMFKIGLRFSIFFLLFTLPTFGQAEGIDSVFYIEWSETMKGRDGTISELKRVRMWVDGDRMLTYPVPDRRVSVVKDSIYVIDDHFKSYSIGPREKATSLWISDEDLEKAKKIGAIVIKETGKTKAIEGFESKEIVCSLPMNKTMYPLKYNAWISDRLRFPDTLLPNIYLATTIHQSMVSAGFAEVNDSLLLRGVVPLYAEMRIDVPIDTAVVIMSRLVDFKKVGVPDDFFFPPLEYSYIPLPEEDERSSKPFTLPLPGGVKEE